MGRKPKKKVITEAEVEVLPAEQEDDLNVDAGKEALQEILDPEIIADDELINDDDAALPAVSSRAVSVFDPLTTYLREIARYPKLTQEEEKQLALKYIEKKDLKAARKLILSNLWLVVKIARDYEAAARNVLDLIQEGNIGLMEAVKNFDPHREVRFPSYASWWVKAYIIRYVMANWRMVKLGTTQAQRKLFFNLKKEKEKLEREGILPEPKLLAERLQVRESDVVEMEQRLSGADVSVDAPTNDDSDASLLSVLPSSNLTAEETLSRKQTQAQFKEALDSFKQTLQDRDRVIFEERLLGEEKATLQDISDRFGLSKERVRQLESRLKDKLKGYLQEQLGDTLEELEL